MDKNFGFYLLPSLVRGLAGFFIMVPITTYYLDAVDFGLVAILAAITAPLSPLASAGASWVYGANYFQISEEERKELLFNILFLDILLKGVLVLACWLGREWLLKTFVADYRPIHEFYFKLILLTYLFGTLWPTISSVLIIMRRAKLHAIFEIGQWIVGLAVIVLGLAVFRLQVLALFLAPLISSLVSLLGELVFVHRHIRWMICGRWISEILRVGVPSIPANVAEAAGNAADRYFIQRWIGLASLGIYSHSQAYANIFRMFNKAFGRTIGPRALEVFSRVLPTDELKSAMRSWYAVLFFGGTCCALFAGELVGLLTHGKFTAAAPLVTVWFFLIISHSFGIPSSQYLLSRKAVRVLMQGRIFVSLAGVGLTALLTYNFGILGAGVSIVFTNFCIQLVFVWMAKRLGSPYRDEYIAFFPAVSIAVVAWINSTFTISLPFKVFWVLLSGSAMAIYLFTRTGRQRNLGHSLPHSTE